MLGNKFMKLQVLDYRGKTLILTKKDRSKLQLKQPVWKSVMEEITGHLHSSLLNAACNNGYIV